MAKLMVALRSTQTFMLARALLQALSFAVIALSLSRKDLGLYTSMLTFALTLGALSTLGGNYTLGSEVHKYGRDVKLVAYPALIVSAVLGTFLCVLFYPLANLFLPLKEGNSYLACGLILFTEGVVVKNVEVMALLSQMALKFRASQTILLLSPVGKIIGTIVAFALAPGDVTVMCTALLIFSLFFWIAALATLLIYGVVDIGNGRSLLEGIRSWQTPAPVIVRQSLSSMVGVFVGDGAKPVVTMLAGPSVTASLAIALKILEFCLIPTKGFLYENFHRWFVRDASDGVVLSDLSKRIAFLSLAGTAAYVVSLAGVTLAFPDRYGDIIWPWILLSPLLLTRSFAYAFGDALVAQGAALLRAVAQLVLVGCLAVGLLLFESPGGMIVAVAIVAGELVATTLAGLFAWWRRMPPRA